MYWVSVQLTFLRGASVDDILGVFSLKLFGMCQWWGEIANCGAWQKLLLHKWSDRKIQTVYVLHGLYRKVSLLETTGKGIYSDTRRLASLNLVLLFGDFSMTVHNCGWENTC